MRLDRLLGRVGPRVALAGAAIASIGGPIQEQLKGMATDAIDGFLKHEHSGRRPSDVDPNTPVALN
jgi:hypothetical protein